MEPNKKDCLQIQDADLRCLSETYHKEKTEIQDEYGNISWEEQLRVQFSYI